MNFLDKRAESDNYDWIQGCAIRNQSWRSSCARKLLDCIESKRPHFRAKRFADHVLVGLNGSLDLYRHTSSGRTYPRIFQINKSGDLVVIWDPTTANIVVVKRDVMTRLLSPQSREHENRNSGTSRERQWVECSIVGRAIAQAMGI
jgi:hypothetical protein